MENVWLTPEWLLDRIRFALGGQIDLDPCTQPDNPCKATDFIATPDDGILLPWSTGRVFCNPPFSAATAHHWVDKCLVARSGGSTVILLLPLRLETKALQTALRYADETLIFSGRIAFQGMTRHTALPCVLFSFGVSLKSMADLGVVLACAA